MDLGTDNKKCLFLRGDWTTYLENANSFEFKISHNMEGLIWPLDEHENVHFDNEHDIHTSPEIYKANGYGYDLDLLIIPH